MKKIMSVILITAMLLPVWFLAGCSSKSNLFGQPITENKIIPIADILKQPEQFAGKAVRVEGKIIEECPAGGWFMLKDESGVIYVNLHPSYFAIPQAIGRKVIAQGEVKQEYSQVSVIGKGVQLK